MDEDELTAADGASESELHSAAWDGDIDLIRELIDSGVDVNWRDSIGETALFGAASWGHSEAVRLLLSAGAEHDLHEIHSGYTPLHWAARSNIETIKVLIEFGADPNAQDLFGNFPVDIAHQYGMGENVSFLKSVGPPIASRRNKIK